MGLRDHMQQSNLSVLLTDGRSLPIQFLSKNIDSHHTGISREVEFAQLPSGTLIDLVRDSSGKLVFAVFEDGKTTLHDKVKYEDITFITPQVHSSLMRAVRFPTRLGATSTARELLLD